MTRLGARLPNPLFLNTVLLGGGAAEKLAAARAAGFHQVELWTQDVADLPAVAPTTTLAAATGIGFTDYQVLLDYDGAPGARRADKRAEALAMLDTARDLGIATVLVPASTDPQCDRSRIAEDLAWLVDAAKARGRRIAYEGMAWSTCHPRLADAWAAVRDLDPAHSGVVLDSYHLFVRGDDARALDAIPPERIFLAQFSDVAGPVALSDAKQVARHARLLPGEGVLPLGALLRRLLASGYAGPVGLEVFNDARHARPPHETAIAAMAALCALIQSVEEER